MNTKKPSLGAGRQMSRPAVSVSAPSFEVPDAKLQKLSNLFQESKSAPVEVPADLEIPIWSHTRGIFEGRKPTTTSETLRGVTHSGYPFETLQNNQPVFLIADPFGQVVKPDVGHSDPTAISVQDKPKGGKHIGYLSKTVANTITKYLNKGYKYEAEILTVKGGYEGVGGEMLNYGVDITIRFYAPLE